MNPDYIIENGKENPYTFIKDEILVRECSYDDIKVYKSRAAKERVSISDTNNTIWFNIMRIGWKTHDTIGCCGLYLAKNKCRIKGDFIEKEFRGQGFGHFLTEIRKFIAKDKGYDTIEVLTLHPHYYKKEGFTINKEIRSGVWHADLVL